MLWGKMWREVCKLHFCQTLNEIIIIWENCNFLDLSFVHVWFETAKAASWSIPFSLIVRWPFFIKTVFWFLFFSFLMKRIEYHCLLFNKLSLCPYMVRKPSISVIRTWQISCDIRNWPYLEVHCRFSFIASLAAILKREAVLAVHFSGNALKKSTSICFSSQRYPEVDLEFS